MVGKNSYESILDYANYFLHNQIKLFSNEFYSLFVRRVGSEVIEITKASANQKNLPLMENDGRAITTFTLRKLDFENITLQNDYTEVAIQILTQKEMIEPDLKMVLGDGFEKFIPNELDMRIKRISESFVREGQESFRKKLMLIYSEKCAVTGTNVKSVLEAAHVVPFNGRNSNHIQNGIILRRDIHRLFDTYQLSVNPENNLICIEPNLANSDYWIYKDKALNSCEDIRLKPSKEALQLHYDKHFSMYLEGSNTD